MSNRNNRRLNNKISKKNARSIRLDDGAASTLQSGIEAHKMGNLDLAVMLYEQVLEKYPKSPDAIQCMGLIEMDRKNFPLAEAFIRKAIRIHDYPSYHKNLALVLHELGNDKDAAKEISLYLKHVPDDADALNTLGNYQRDTGMIEAAIESYQSALALTPNVSGIISNIGLAHYLNGQYQLAIPLFNQALECNPEDKGAHNNLALTLALLGKKDEAREHYNKALEIDPNYAEAQNNLADILRDEDLEEAEKTLRKALSSSPNRVRTLQSLAVTLLMQDKDIEAQDCLIEAMGIEPNNATTLYFFGQSLMHMENYEKAIEFFDGAIQLKTQYAVAFSARGYAKICLLEHNKGIEDINKALELYPAMPEALSNLGMAYLKTDRLKEATKYLEMAVEMAPGYAQAHWNLALALLGIGELKRGWDGYGTRYENPGFTGVDRHFPQPQWDGSSLSGKSIVLWAEQGLGDEILFASVIPDLMKQYDAEVHIECDTRLVDLYARSFPGTQVHARPFRDAEEGKGKYDFQMAYPDLCPFYRDEISKFPDEKFLTADPDKVDFWHKRLAKISTRPKIGIAWRSMVMTTTRQIYYAELDMYAPIFAMEGVDFINIQYGDTTEEIAQAESMFGITLHDWDDIDLKDDQDDLAALMSNLDLVISPSIAATQLSAGLGTETFSYLPERKIWVMAGEDDDPWHPSLHYFTKNWDQPWEPLMGEIAEAAKKHLNLTD